MEHLILNEQLNTAELENQTATIAQFQTLKGELAKDGNMFEALIGENPQEGCVGYGDTRQKAINNCIANWHGETINIKKEN